MAGPHGSPAGGADVDVAAEPHLRAVLESQPVVLARVAPDGTFLAVNESGLSMMGATSLEQMLGRSLCGLVAAEEQENCRAFLGRVGAGELGSLEVELTGLTGLSHTMEIHARPHPGAPDGLTSILVTFRDVSEARRLEQSLVEAMARQGEQEAAHQSERAALMAELDQLRHASEGHAHESARVTDLEAQVLDAQRRHAEEANRLSAEIAGLTEALDEQGRIVTEQTERLARMATIEAELADAKRLHDELSARYDTDTATLRQALDDALRQAVEEAERRLQEAERRAEEAERRAEEAERHGQDALARHQTEQAEREGRLHSLEGSLEEARREREDLQGRYDTDTEALRNALNEAMAEQARLAEALGEQERHGAEHSARISALELELVEARSAHDARLSELELAVSDAQASADARVRDLESALADAERTARERVSELEERLALTEQSGQARVRELEAAVEAADQARRDIASELDGRVLGLQAEIESLGSAYKKADAAFLAERRGLEAEIAAAVSARQDAETGMTTLLAERDAARDLLRRLADTAEGLAREAAASAATLSAGVPAVPQPAAADVRAGTLAGGIETRLAEELGAHVSLTVLVASPDSSIVVPVDAFERALLTFAANRGGAMKSGQATVEVADVQIDDGVAAFRQMTPGAYVLWATHLTGKGATRHLPDGLFETADQSAWASVDGELHASLETLRASGTAAWLSREGDNGIVLELYLPRLGADAGAS